MSIFEKLPIGKKGPIGLISLSILIAAIIFVNLYDGESKPKLKREHLAKAYIAMINISVLKYYHANKDYPESLSDLLKEYEGEPYLKKEKYLTDPWGNGFIYVYPARYPGNSYDLYSCGPDGTDDYGKGDDVTRDWPN